MVLLVMNFMKNETKWCVWSEIFLSINNKLFNVLWA